MAKKLTIQYRQLKTEGLFEGVDLKAMTVDVLRHRGWDSQAKSRILNLDQDGSVVILNKVSPVDTWNGPIFSGQIIHLQDGTEVQAVLQSLEDESPEFQLTNIDLGERAKVLRGALYFAIVGNHVGLIEGQQVRGRTLERYMTALLQKADELEPTQVIILNSKFMAGDGKELSESSEITVTAAPSAAPTVGEQAEAVARIVEREAGAAREHEQATVFDILRMMGWSDEAIVSLGQEIPPGGWVEGSFKVFIKESQRKKKPISRATINEALRNIDPADLGLKGDGSERGGIVKLSIQKDVATIGTGSLVDPQSAMEQIVNALRDWAAQGKIDCRFD